MIGGGDEVEIVHAPDVAEVQRQLLARPIYLADRPIEVEPELWHQARKQLADALASRGWPLLADDKCGRPNFLLLGVPVVMNG